MTSLSPKLITHKITDAILIGALLLAVVLNSEGVNLTAENGLLENAQVFVLLYAAGAFYLRSAIHIGAAYRAIRAFGLFMTAFLLAGVARELSFGEVFGIAPHLVDWIKYLTAGVVLGLLAFSLYAYTRPTQTRFKQTLDLLHSPALLHFYAAIFIFAFASIFEKGDFGMIKSTFLEELLELAAFMALLRAAFQLGAERLWKPRIDVSFPAAFLQKPNREEITSR